MYVGGATLYVGGATLDVGGATVDVGGATSVVGKAAEGRCTLGSGSVAFEVLGELETGQGVNSTHVCVCLCTLFVCVHVCVRACVCAYVCTCVFTQQLTCICVRPFTNNQIWSCLSPSLPKKDPLL